MSLGFCKMVICSQLLVIFQECHFLPCIQLVNLKNTFIAIKQGEVNADLFLSPELVHFFSYLCLSNAPCVPLLRKIKKKLCWPASLNFAQCHLFQRFHLCSYQHYSYLKWSSYYLIRLLLLHLGSPWSKHGHASKACSTYYFILW